MEGASMTPENSATKMGIQLISEKSETNESITHPAEEDFTYNFDLYKAVVRGDWEAFSIYVSSNNSLLTAKINKGEDTPLNLAVGSGQAELSFVEKLVNMMKPEDLALPDRHGYTALHNTAPNGNTKIAHILVNKYPELTQIVDNNKQTPLLRATTYGHKDLVWYLCKVTRDEEKDGIPSPFRGLLGATLLTNSINADLYDVALYLLVKCPETVMKTDRIGRLAIHMLAQKSFPSMSNDWRRFLQYFSSFVYGMWKTDKTKTMHEEYLELVEHICNQIGALPDQKQIGHLLRGTTLEASQHGNAEFIEWVIDADPTLIWEANRFKQSLLHLAVKHRQENVFTYLRDMGEFKNAWTVWKSIPEYTPQEWRTQICMTEESILHLAARLGPSTKLSEISGAALQVQRELQWYKEVESIVQPSYRSWNSPREMFTKNHEQLVRNGEEWMKQMASSSMLVATLIATVVFAAAFTVPGGNTQDKGRPIFLNAVSYKFFAISNASSFFSSLTSILMFLSILTARYAEEDFLRSLPQRLIIGLSMLFFAILTMSIAFSATYFIMLGHQLAWVSIIIALLTSFPITLFAFLQLPLFVEMFISTYMSPLYKGGSN